MENVKKIGLTLKSVFKAIEYKYYLRKTIGEKI